MGRQIYVPPPPVGEPVFALVEQAKGTTYLYNFMSPDLCEVKKFPDGGAAWMHAYRVVRSQAEPVGPLCNCPWMTHHPDEHCKHAKLVRAAWAHWDGLSLLAVHHGRAALDISQLRDWVPGDPPLPILPAS